MAKGKSRGTRDAPQSLTVSLRSENRQQKPASRHLLTQIQDLRSFDFSPGTRPAKLFSGQPARFTLDPAQVKKTQQKNSTRQRQVVPTKIAFSAPKETLVCIRRSRRKEVLFAKRKTGKGGQKKPRRSPWSEYKC